MRGAYMWQKSYSTTVKDLTPSQIWQLWSDIPNRPAWDEDTLWAKSNGPFQNGTVITFRPKGWFKNVSMTIVDCVPLISFTDHTSFFLANLYGTHHMEKENDGLKLTTTIKITGPLAWLWRKIVGEEIVKTLPEQTAKIIELARKTK